MTPTRRTVILRTSVTPCSTMPSLISLLVTLLKAGQRIIPLDAFKDEWGVTEHFRPQNVFICRRLFSCDSFAHCIKRSPDLRFLILFGSPAILIIVLCTTNGEREEIVHILHSVFQAIPFELRESHQGKLVGPTLSTPRGEKYYNQYRPLCEVCPRDRGKVVGTLQGLTNMYYGLIQM